MRPPRSSAIRTTAWLAPTPASRRTAASNPVTNFMSQPQVESVETESDCLESDADTRQTVSTSCFCLGRQDDSKQIQIKYCRRAAPKWPKGPKPEQLTFHSWPRRHRQAPFCVDRTQRRGLHSERGMGSKPWLAMLT